MESDSTFSDVHKNVSLLMVVDNKWRNESLSDEETLVPAELAITIGNFDDPTAEEPETDLAAEFYQWNDLNLRAFQEPSH
eukprot:CFRG3578T1